MWASPEDFLTRYGEREFEELFRSDKDRCQEELDQAFGEMQPSLMRYVPFPPVSSPKLPYERFLMSIQLKITRHNASQQAAPREYVTKEFKWAFERLSEIADQTLQLPIYNPAVDTERPVSASATLVPRTGSRSSFASYARKWG